MPLLPRTKTGSWSACMWTTLPSRAASTACSAVPIATSTSRDLLTSRRRQSRFALPAMPSSDPKSKVAHSNIPQTCGACHGKQMVMAGSGVSSAPFTSYEQSVHGKAVAGGSDKAAVCTDCHGTHEILAAANPKSPIAKSNVPATCAKCHESIQHEYAQSIHGQAMARGNWQAPVCTDCHGIHTIKAPKDPNSAVASENVQNTCGSCHASVNVPAEFGVAGFRVSSYHSSYGGMAQ